MVDSSALVAIIRGEPERRAFLSLLADAETPKMTSVTWVEVRMVAFGRLGDAGLATLSELVEDAAIEIVSVSTALADSAFAAFRRYGKRRHEAALNFGDCFSYALAKETQLPLLFKGDDFSKTDVIPAAAVRR